MERVHDPRWDDVERQVDALYEVADFATFALYNAIIDKTHKVIEDE